MVTVASDNPFPSALFVETADASIPTPAAGTARLFLDDDGLFKWKDEAGTVTGLAGSAGSVATDAIWDAAGDLAVGSGANTAAKLAIGATNGMSLQRIGGVVAWGFPPGYEYDYVAITSAVSVTGTSAAGATTAITGNAVAYDGSTRVKVEVSSPFIEAPAVLNASIVVNLWDGSTDLGRIGILTAPAAGQCRAPLRAAIFLTPSNASHTYTVKTWVTSGTGSFGAGAGGGSGANYIGAFMRIVRA